jgi:hypothetical protein
MNQAAIEMPMQTVAVAREVGRLASESCTQRAERGNPEFSLQARQFVVQYLTDHGNSSGEDIVEAATAAGIRSHDKRAWGSVFSRMNGKQIRCLRSDLPRKHGHGTSGGKLWALVR